MEELDHFFFFFSGVGFVGEFSSSKSHLQKQTLLRMSVCLSAIQTHAPEDVSLSVCHTNTSIWLSAVLLLGREGERERELW